VFNQGKKNFLQKNIFNFRLFDIAKGKNPFSRKTFLPQMEENNFHMGRNKTEFLTSILFDDIAT